MIQPTEARRYALPWQQQLLRFAMTGSIGFAVDATAYWVFAACVGMHWVEARLCAFLPATLVTWVMNRRWVFARTQASPLRARDEYLRYLLVQSSGSAVAFLVFYVYMKQVAQHSFFGLVLGAGAAMASNFVLSRILVFSNLSGSRSK